MVRRSGRPDALRLQEEPEQLGIVLVGRRSDAPEKLVRTSEVVRVEGRLCTIRFGSTYKLGAMNVQYEAFLRSHDYPIDSDNPIRIVSKRMVFPR